MRFLFFLSTVIFSFASIQAEEDYPVSEDSKLHEGVPKGEMIKGSYTAKDNNVFPGTEREYQLYIPAGLDKTKPIPFMVFQDGVIYNAPVVFDNLIAKKEIPAMIGIFIKPGVVPAANPNALPRFNRSYEYDSVTDTYSRFLIDEFLPAITKKHGITLSTDPNDAGISGNSSGGICAFMVAWHRSDRFRRIFTGVGTYVGIHGADQLPVLVRKMEPKPIKVYLQSGENDNNLYCGDWWMANQMMERSLTWAGYDVAHTWGTGGHNGKQATAIFPDVMRWLWKGYPEAKIKANSEGKSKWLGYEVLKEGSEWEVVPGVRFSPLKIVANVRGDVVWLQQDYSREGGASLIRLPLGGSPEPFGKEFSPFQFQDIAFGKDDCLYVLCSMRAEKDTVFKMDNDGKRYEVVIVPKKDLFVSAFGSVLSIAMTKGAVKNPPLAQKLPGSGLFSEAIALSPDQTTLYSIHAGGWLISAWQYRDDGSLAAKQSYCVLQPDVDGRDAVPRGLCVDTNGWLYVTTSLGIQVCDQAGRVNFIIPTPQQAVDICFGGKDLSELFIICGDKIYKRQTKAHGGVSGQQPPIKPAPPKL